jgi:CheY-like chemotaxis protein
MDGIEAGRLIEEYYTIPVLYITGYNHRAEAIQREGKSLLMKPFDPEDLKNAIACL